MEQRKFKQFYAAHIKLTWNFEWNHEEIKDFKVPENDKFLVGKLFDTQLQLK